MALIHVSDSDFEEKVIKSPLPVLVDFWAAWCGPCRMVAPALENFAREFEGKLIVAKIDVDVSPVLSLRYDIMSIPTLILFRDGKPVERTVGARSQEELCGWLKSKLA